MFELIRLFLKINSIPSMTLMSEFNSSVLLTELWPYLASTASKWEVEGGRERNRGEWRILLNSLTQGPQYHH
jgi:hypothetical protein